MIMAAKKSQELWPKGLETKGANNVSSSWRSKVRGNLHPSSFPSAESEFSLAQLFALFRPSTVDEACQQGGGQSSLLGLPMWIPSGRLRIHIALTHSGV